MTYFISIFSCKSARSLLSLLLAVIAGRYHGPRLMIAMIFMTQNNFKNRPVISDRLLRFYHIFQCQGGASTQGLTWPWPTLARSLTRAFLLCVFFFSWSDMPSLSYILCLDHLAIRTPVSAAVYTFRLKDSQHHYTESKFLPIAFRFEFADLLEAELSNA